MVSSESRLGRNVQLQRDGFLEVEGSRLPHSGAKEADYITINFKTTEPDGLLFWQGQKTAPAANNKDYLSIAIKDGFVHFR